jgi:hypothetical protein
MNLGTEAIVFMRSLHDGYEMNSCRADRVGLSACFNPRTVGMILMKFGMDIMPLVASLKLSFFIYYSQ